MILSRFKKGVKESRALSFGLSAKSLCDKSCRMLKEGFCYAETPERLYKHYHTKLVRHRKIRPENLVRLATKEVNSSLKWFRFSVSGSLPSKSTVKNWAAYSSAIRELCVKLRNNGTLIHMPVESIGKARSYRKILGDILTVRRTVQTLPSLLKSKDCVAYVVGSVPGKAELETKLLANRLRKTRSVVICPAIIGDSKCGKCTACASSKVDVVLYPLHR